MKLYELLMLIFSACFVLHAVIKMLKGMSFEEYSIGRGYFMWMLFCLKAIFIIVTIAICIDWRFLEYQIF